MLYVPVNNLSVTSGRDFHGWTSTKLGLMFLVQGHNAVTPVRLEPAAVWFQVKHSTFHFVYEPCITAEWSLPPEYHPHDNSALQIIIWKNYLNQNSWTRKYSYFGEKKLCILSEPMQLLTFDGAWPQNFYQRRIHRKHYATYSQLVDAAIIKRLMTM